MGKGDQGIARKDFKQGKEELPSVSRYEGQLTPVPGTMHPTLSQGSRAMPLLYSLALSLSLASSVPCAVPPTHLLPRNSPVFMRKLHPCWMG